jgi:hypothetical protein
MSDQQESTVIVSQDYEAKRIVASSPFLKAHLPDLASSLNVADEKQSRLLYNSVTKADRSISELIGDVFEASNVIVQVVTKLNKKTGVEETFPRIILVDDDGVSYEAFSWGVLDSVKLLSVVKGPPPWKPQLLLTPVQIPTDGGGRVIKVYLAETDTPKKKK